MYNKSISSDDDIACNGKLFYTSSNFSNYNFGQCELTVNSVNDSEASGSWPWDDESDMSAATETL